MLAMLDSTVLLSSFVATSAFAQDAPYNEEYMQQHDGGDRDEYLQEWKAVTARFVSHLRMTTLFLLPLSLADQLTR
jgi:hypothetical protein